MQFDAATITYAVVASFADEQPAALPALDALRAELETIVNSPGPHEFASLVAIDALFRAADAAVPPDYVPRGIAARFPINPARVARHGVWSISCCLAVIGERAPAGGDIRRRMSQLNAMTEVIAALDKYIEAPDGTATRERVNNAFTAATDAVGEEVPIIFAEAAELVMQTPAGSA